jgi:hypothetical protein
LPKDELIVNNRIFRKTDGNNVILTMNGEIEGFNEKQRNILTSFILSKFIAIYFDKMEKNEYEEIFVILLNNNKKEYIDKVKFFIELYHKMIDKMKTNINLADPIVTLRNLKYYCNFKIQFLQE